MTRRTFVGLSTAMGFMLATVVAGGLAFAKDDHHHAQAKLGEKAPAAAAAVAAPSSPPGMAWLFVALPALAFALWLLWRMAAKRRRDSFDMALPNQGDHR